MAVEASSSILTEPEELLRATLAASSTWQTLCGAANATEALASIYYDEVPVPENEDAEGAWDEYQSLLPFAMVTTSPDGLSLLKTGTNAYAQGGRLGIAFEVEIPTSQTTDQERARWFKNRIGDVFMEMISLSDTAGYLTIESLNLVDWFFGAPEQDAARGYTIGTAQVILTYGAMGE